MNKYKIGQKVYVKEFGTWGIVTGFSGEKEYDSKLFACAEEGITVRKEGVSRVSWLFLREVEPFIEPKYKVGDKFVNVNGWKLEIVKASLNKKRGEYCYLMFDVNDGYYIVETDSSLSRMDKLGKPKVVKQEVVEMKLEEVCKLLGKEIKIIK